MNNIIVRIVQGFSKGLNPVLVEEGLSGSYFLKDRFRNIIGIFKAIDEEPFTPMNPKHM